LGLGFCVLVGFVVWWFDDFLAFGVFGFGGLLVLVVFLGFGVFLVLWFSLVLVFSLFLLFSLVLGFGVLSGIFCGFGFCNLDLGF